MAHSSQENHPRPAERRFYTERKGGRADTATIFTPSLVSDIIAMSAKKNLRLETVREIKLVDVSYIQNIDFPKSTAYYLDKVDREDMLTLLAFCYAATFMETQDVNTIDPTKSVTLTTTIVLTQLSLEGFPGEGLKKTLQSGFYKLVPISAEDLVKWYQDLNVKLTDIYHNLIKSGNKELLILLLLASHALNFCLMGKHLIQANRRTWIENRLNSFKAALPLSTDCLKVVPYPSIQYCDNVNFVYSQNFELKKTIASAVLGKAEIGGPINKIFAIVSTTWGKKKPL